MGHQIAAMFCDFEPLFTRIRDRLQSASARFVRFSRLLKFAVFMSRLLACRALVSTQVFICPTPQGPPVSANS